MLSVLLAITTLCWIQGGICANRSLLCSTCFPASELTKSTLGSLRLDDKNKITWQGCWLKIGDTNQRRLNCSNCALAIYLSTPYRRAKRPSGNCEISITASVHQVHFQRNLRQNGDATPETKTEYPFAAHVETKFPDERTRLFRSVRFRNDFHRARITGLKYAIRGYRIGIMPEEITKEIKPLMFVCKQCNLPSRRRRSSGKADGVFFGRAPGREFFTRKKILAKKRLRKRRDILANTSSSYTYSAYFTSPHAVNVSRVFPVTLTLPPPPQPSIFCPQSAVINSTTIFLATPATSVRFNATLVPTGKPTPFLRVIGMLRTRPSTSIVRSVQTTTSSFGGVPVDATPSSRDVAQIRTSTANATFIYNSRLVTAVYSAANSSYAFTATWSCATVVPSERTASVSHGAAAPSNNPNPSKTNPHKKMDLVLGLAVGGGTILGFLLIAALTVFIRRYRRIRDVRKKAKQISYFNRYDRSADWEEPLGGSRLSVFTLKNSKFDIFEWETPNEGKRQDAKEEDFGGRSL